jgi:hypothetical protein
VHLLATNGVQQEFVDIYPQAVNGASGSNGQTLDPKDPSIALSPEVIQQAQGAAPATDNLKAQFLGNNAGAAFLYDGNTSPITFGPQGIPCFPKGVTGGTVCDSVGGLTAYWLFFQDTVTQNWEAITVTPAGRIQKWSYVGQAWGRI